MGKHFSQLKAIYKQYKWGQYAEMLIDFRLIKNHGNIEEFHKINMINVIIQYSDIVLGRQHSN